MICRFTLPGACDVNWYVSPLSVIAIETTLFTASQNQVQYAGNQADQKEKETDKRTRFLVLHENIMTSGLALRNIAVVGYEYAQGGDELLEILGLWFEYGDLLAGPNFITQDLYQRQR